MWNHLTTSPDRPRKRLFPGLIPLGLIALLIISLAVTLYARQSTISAYGVRTSANSGLGVYVATYGSIYKLDSVSGAQLWHTSIGGSTLHATASATGSLLYVSSQNGAVVALHTDTGKVAWHEQTGAAVLSAPLIAQKVVYVSSSDGYLYAYNAQEGGLLWRYHGGPGTAVFTVQAPSLQSGVLYASSTDETAQSYVFALKASTGAQLWRIKLDSLRASDVQVTTDGIYLSAFTLEPEGTTGTAPVQSYVYALDPSSGKQLWHSKGITGTQLAAPAVASGVVYVGSEDASLSAFNGQTGARLWHTSTGGAIYTSPQVVNGLVYVGIDGTLQPSSNPTTDAVRTPGKLLAFNANTGAQRWQHSLINYHGSAFVIHGNVLYVASADSTVYTLAATGGLQASSSPLKSNTPANSALLIVAP